MPTKLFVGNLSYATTEQELREAFSQQGRTVRSVRIAVDRETQRPRGFAFVEVETDADAESAIKEWNGKLGGGCWHDTNIFLRLHNIVEPDTLAFLGSKPSDALIQALPVGHLRPHPSLGKEH